MKHASRADLVAAMPLLDCSAGTEFYEIKFSDGTWQDFDYSRDKKERLADIGVEKCRRIQGTTCPGGAWNVTCRFGLWGPKPFETTFSFFDVILS